MEKKKWYVVQIHYGSYDDYTEEWWLVHHSILPLEWKKVLPVENEIKEIFDKAKKLCAKRHQEYQEKVNQILIKHGRADLISRSVFFILSQVPNISSELRAELARIEQPPWQWEDYVEEVSQGKIKKLQADLTFEYPIW